MNATEREDRDRRNHDAYVKALAEQRLMMASPAWKAYMKALRSAEKTYAQARKHADDTYSKAAKS